MLALIRGILIATRELIRMVTTVISRKRRSSADTASKISFCRLFENYCSWSLQIDRFVIAAEPVTGFVVKGRRIAFEFINCEAKRFRVGQKRPSQLGQAPKSISLAALLAIYIYALQINCLRSVSDYVSFENRLAVLRPNPNTTLLDATCSAFHESLRVSIEWVSSGFLGSHFGVNREYVIKVFQRCLAQAGNILTQQEWSALLKHQFAANSPRFEMNAGIVVPKTARHVALAAEQVGGIAGLRHAGQGL